MFLFGFASIVRTEPLAVCLGCARLGCNSSLVKDPQPSALDAISSREIDGQIMLSSPFVCSRASWRVSELVGVVLSEGEVELPALVVRPALALPGPTPRP